MCYLCKAAKVDNIGTTGFKSKNPTNPVVSVSIMHPLNKSCSRKVHNVLLMNLAPPIPWLNKNAHEDKLRIKAFSLFFSGNLRISENHDGVKFHYLHESVYISCVPTQSSHEHKANMSIDHVLISYRMLIGSQPNP